MRAWTVLLVGFGYLATPAAAQLTRLNPNQKVYVTYEKAYFYFTQRDGTKKDMRKSSLVSVVPNGDGYFVRLGGCQFRLSPVHQDVREYRGKPYSGVRFRLADPLAAEPAKMEDCQAISLGDVFIGENAYSKFFLYVHLARFREGKIAEVHHQVQGILQPVRASEIREPDTVVEWRPEGTTAASMPDWMGPVALFIAGGLAIEFLCRSDLKACAAPLK